MKKVRFFVFTAVFLSLCFPGFSDTLSRKVPRGEEAWRYLLKAEDAFAKGNFSAAIENADTACARQKQHCDWERFTLENLLKKNSVRNAGDVLEDVILVLKEEENTEALGIINERLENFGRDFFSNSFSKLIEKEEFFSYCPEADYLTAKVYRLEGEYELALTYMKRAYAYSLNLRVKDVKFDILYDIASLSEILSLDDDFERHLLLILSENEYFTNENLMNSLTRFIEGDEPSGVEKFFLLYRNNEYKSLKALVELSDFYASKGETQKALRCSALGSIIAVTKIDESLKLRITNYDYKSFANLIYTSTRNEEILEWGNNCDVWKLFYLFSKASIASGKLNFGLELTKILAANTADSYWKKRFEALLVN